MNRCFFCYTCPFPSFCLNHLSWKFVLVLWLNIFPFLLLTTCLPLPHSSRCCSSVHAHETPPPPAPAALHEMIEKDMGRSIHKPPRYRILRQHPILSADHTVMHVHTQTFACAHCIRIIVFNLHRAPSCFYKADLMGERGRRDGKINENGGTRGRKGGRREREHKTRR